jgi:uncharacterized membrane protein YesL
MSNLNQNENPMLYWFSKIGDFCVLSVLWILLCIPIVTFVPASIALFDSVAHCIHGTEDGPTHRFFRTFKSELLKGILLSLVWLVIGGTLFYGFSILLHMGQENQAMAAYSLVYLFTMLIPLGILTWLIAVESRFHHSFFGLFRTAAIYAIGHLPTTIILLFILIVAIIAVLCLPILGLLVPAIAATVQCWFVERIFQKYIPQEDKTDE